jgi:antitoxin MazE
MPTILREANLVSLTYLHYISIVHCSSVKVSLVLALWRSGQSRCLTFTQCNYTVYIVKATIVKIGNSRGIRIPKPVFEQCGFKNEVDMEVHNHELVIRSARKPREGWNEAFRSMEKHGDDVLLDFVAESGPAWDDEEWEWKE